MQLAGVIRGSCRNVQGVDACQFLGGGGEIGVLNAAQLPTLWGQTVRRASDGGGAWVDVKLVEKVCQSSVE